MEIDKNLAVEAVKRVNMEMKDVLKKEINKIYDTMYSDNKKSTSRELDRIIAKEQRSKINRFLTQFIIRIQKEYVDALGSIIGSKYDALKIWSKANSSVELPEFKKLDVKNVNKEKIKSVKKNTVKEDEDFSDIIRIGAVSGAGIACIAISGIPTLLGIGLIAVAARDTYVNQSKIKNVFKFKGSRPSPEPERSQCSRTSNEMLEKVLYVQKSFTINTLYKWLDEIEENVINACNF